MKMICIIAVAIVSACGALAESPAVAFYFIKTDVKTLGEAELDKAPFLTDDDILSYCWTTHTMALATNAIVKLPSTRDVGTGGKAFVVVVNGERRFRGAFWSSASSVGHMNPVILTDHYDAKAVALYRRYPTLGGRGSEAMIVDGRKMIDPDPRDDQKLRETLKNLGKLTEKEAPNQVPENRARKLADPQH